MPLTSKITKYDTRWPSDFSVEAARLRVLFAEKLVEIHHVGSTAVPELAAKPEIDVLAVMGHNAKIIDWSSQLAKLGYVRGSDLSDGHQFYKRDINDIRTHKLHVCVTGHSEIARMLMFRDLLRQDVFLRQEYQELKIQLEQNNTLGIGEYLMKKAPFINQTIERNLGMNARFCLQPYQGA